MKDPAVRKDGLCYICKKPRHPERSRLYARGQAESDPFCSTQCCKTKHKTVFKWAPTFSAQGYEPPMQLEHSINPRELPHTLLPGGGDARDG